MSFLQISAALLLTAAGAVLGVGLARMASRRDRAEWVHYIVLGVGGVVMGIGAAVGAMAVLLVGVLAMLGGAIVQIRLQTPV